MYIYIYVNPQKNRKVKSHESSDKLLFFLFGGFYYVYQKKRQHYW